MDGFPSLFAHVFLTGVVDDRRSVGITEENVRLVEREVTDNKGRRLIYFHFGGGTMKRGSARRVAAPANRHERSAKRCRVAH
jgi:hypothetical protein